MQGRSPPGVLPAFFFGAADEDETADRVDGHDTHEAGRQDDALTSEAAVAMTSDDIIVTAPIHMFRARPVTEGERRLVYCEASNEAFDSAGDQVLKGALLKSAPYFERFGNIDVDHMSVLGYRLGFQNPRQFEIGKPLQVRESADGVLVKGEIYRGGHALADEFWGSLTLEPPMHWWPSVYIRHDDESRRRVWDAVEKKHKRAIVKCDWAGLGFAREPVHRTLAQVSRVPFGAFLKAMNAALAMPCCDACADDAASCKALTATGADGVAATDPVVLTGGAALRRQSMAGAGDRVANLSGAAARFVEALGLNDTERQQRGLKACAHHNATPTFAGLVDHFRDCDGMDAEDARDAAHVLLRNVTRLVERAAA